MPEPETTRAAGADPPLRKRVLIVDDNAANRLALDALLSSPEVEPVPAASGHEALRLLLAEEFALVLMDVHMPVLDGFDTTALIRSRERTRATPVIFLTAVYTDERSMRRAYSLGAIDYLTKPFDHDVLKAKVAALVRHARDPGLVAQQAEALGQKQREADHEHRAREAAEAANRAKDEFLAALSHELRAPLNAILGWSAMLAEEPELGPRARKAAQTIARNARAQSRVVDDLVDLSLLAADKLTLDVRGLQLDHVVAGALASTRGFAEQRRVTVEVAIAPGAYHTRADAGRLQQAIVNVLTNAIKFSHEDAVVTVELGRAAGGFELRVRDDGIGIPAELLPRVFERFHQGDGSRTRQHGGLGIGLTLARRLVELHGGRLEAFSDGEGRGATLVLTLPEPVAAADQTGPHPLALPLVEAEPRALRGKRVLVVDDDEDTRELLGVILADAGADLVLAPSAASAFASFGDGGFDAVISDLGMPGEDGLSLMARIRALPPERGGATVAIALSGYGTGEERAASLRAGFHAHLTKPCEPRVLVAVLASLLQPAATALS